MLAQYGVLIGTYSHSDSHVGRWLHELIYLNAAGQQYQCAVDVNEPNGIFQYQILGGLDAGMFHPISSLPDGYHELAHTSSSGAIDYIRSQLIQQPEGCLSIFYGFINAIFRSGLNPWNNVTGDEAGNALATMVTGSVRVYVFGAPYANPEPMPGMHDVHMNQGDPIDGPHHADDGIWQDGCVIIETSDHKLKAYLGKFATQSLHTDNNGWPI